ncbi:Alpha/Beta hydrolase protein [Cladochytrium replicatum]|nr:Alpha/Beta hydrolase protein [Cladochytrium replicatum]
MPVAVSAPARSYHRTTITGDEPRISAGSAGDALTIAYSVHGTGPTKVVLINGQGQVMMQWQAQLEYFRLHSSKYTVCTLDNRNAGQSDTTTTQFDIADLAEDVRGLLCDELKWDSFHIVGISMGGMVALELAHLVVDKVTSLSLISTYAYFTGLPMSGLTRMLFPSTPKAAPSEPSDKPATITPSQKAGFAIDLVFPEWFLNWPLSLVPNKKNRDALLEFHTECFGTPGGIQSAEGGNGQKRACLRHNIAPSRLRQIGERVPCLVICGDHHDAVLVQPGSSEYLATLLNARLEVLAGGGHAVRLEDPMWVNRLLADHLEYGEPALRQ